MTTGSGPAVTARKIALVRVAVGVPMLFVSLMAFVVGFRVAGRSLADPSFWLALLAVFAGFCVYFAKPVRELLRKQ